ncbi:uncharacterized protein PV09_03363 [Verruconis gallopava]|uniref:Cytochrome b561 domain-containing protein n=1 Tax=Verruconis gallopava TaxID=253628 RepID=A0A0D2B2I9_9PEZI|nr:uncharacterized protein PV09_03363 [Verruconis gallopava]KIW05479.1 hypothetical protein PV09_03363 [Verruconis gallopava]
MASATGIPDQSLANEQEPLLGRPGDVSQGTQPIYNNLIIGTGVVAQAGIWILVAIVWAAIFSHELILFSAHPLLNSAGLLLIAQGALILQPTHTPEQKKTGTYIHAALNDVGLAALLSGLVIIEVNKVKNGLPHFESPHAILGFVTYILLIVQALVGFTQYFVPQLYGGVDNAKKVWKYHRASGYVVFTLGLATVSAATQTFYNQKVLDIKLWAVLVASIITLAGIIPRIKKQKLGFS